MSKVSPHIPDSSKTFLRLPHYLLIISGQSLSIDGVSVSRFMIVYSGVTYLVDLLLFTKTLTCINENNEFRIWTKNVCTALYQTAIVTIAPVFLYNSVKQEPMFIRKMEKMIVLVGDQSLEKEIKTSLKRITAVGFVAGVLFSTLVTAFRFLTFSETTWEHCDVYRTLFNNDENIYKNFMIFNNAGGAILAFQSVAGLTFFVSSCRVITLFFKYLENQTGSFGNFYMKHEFNGASNTGRKCGTEEIRRIRKLYEYSCELTAAVDDLVAWPLSVILLVTMPMICFFTYNALVP